MASNDLAAVLALIEPEYSQSVTDLCALPTTAISRIEKAETKRMNTKGYFERLHVAYNTAKGATNDRGNFLAGGGDKYIEILIGAVFNHISGEMTGHYFRNLQAPKSIAENLSQKMLNDVKALNNEREMQFCLGDGLNSKGVVASISYVSPSTTVTFASPMGSFYIEEGRSYYFHHPTTFLRHGHATNSFVCTSVPSATTAVFTGDLTGGTTVAAADIVCGQGSADGESTLNRAIRGPSYWCAKTGDYFGANRDVITKTQGNRYDFGGNMISHQGLEAMDKVYDYRWGTNPRGTLDHVDFWSPANVQGYLLPAYLLRRLNTDDYKNYDGKARMQGDGGRELVVSKYFIATSLYRLNVAFCNKYEIQPVQLWDLDDKKVRSLTANGGILDCVTWTHTVYDNFGCRNPGEQIEGFGLGTADLTTNLNFF